MPPLTLSGIGRIALEATARGLSRVAFLDHGDAAGERHAGDGPHLALAREELTAYAAGRLRVFTVTVDMERCSDFERAVLAACARIPWGGTVSYGGLAAAIGRPGAARAVGGALGRNPLPIIIPCHRVLAAAGRLGGYSGGLDIKRSLLAHEGIR